MEILCHCGHSSKRHSEIAGCEFGWQNGDNEIICMCDLSPEIIELRYWRDTYLKEIYRLRTIFINDDTCPDCVGYLHKEEIGLPSGDIAFGYRCSSCNKIWSYYGKDLTSE
jgi:hypothetical protein